MTLIKMEVGKRFPVEKVINHFKGSEGGASLDYNKEDKTLTLYVGVPKLTSREVNSFRNDVLRFALYPNKVLDTSLILLYIGRELVFDLVYDINVVDSNIDGKIEGNRFEMYLIDSHTGVLKAIRVLGLGENFIKELNQITRNDGRYTTGQYNAWLERDIYTKSIQQLWDESTRIDWDK